MDDILSQFSLHSPTLIWNKKKYTARAYITHEEEKHGWSEKATDRVCVFLSQKHSSCVFGRQEYLRDERPVEMDWFDLADENKFALPNLNDEVHIEQMTAIEDSLEIMAANDDGDVFADECTYYNIENDLPHADSE
ncbi:hypothetical protein WN943_010493 [Citrus x changshan-huyou]